jgi:diguanylate cyclase (GGDEF)-like protein/PAS domain S-box-containing protein
MSVQDDFYKAVLDHLYDGVYFVDKDRRITYWNHGAERITGYRAKDVVGLSCADNLLMHVDSAGNLLCLNGCPLLASIQDGEVHEAPVFLHHAKGHRVPVLVRATPLRNEEGEIIGAVESFSDNSILVNTQKLVDELYLAANQDALTGIANRRGIQALLEAVYFETTHQNIPGAVILADVDLFKQVNDQHGHEAGDKVLMMVANTLQGNIRVTDGVGRWGGEEFLIVLRQTDQIHLKTIAEKLRLLVENSRLPYQDGFIDVTISMGAVIIDPKKSLESTLKCVDELLYQSKNEGRNRVTYLPP